MFHRVIQKITLQAQFFWVTVQYIRSIESRGWPGDGRGIARQGKAGQGVVVTCVVYSSWSWSYTVCSCRYGRMNLVWFACARLAAGCYRCICTGSNRARVCVLRVRRQAACVRRPRPSVRCFFSPASRLATDHRKFIPRAYQPKHYWINLWHYLEYSVYAMTLARRAGLMSWLVVRWTSARRVSWVNK